MNNKIREQLIKNGVKNLKEFGYPDCNEKNILEHSILKAFFIGMLEDNKGIDKKIDKVIDSLLKELNRNN